MGDSTSSAIPSAETQGPGFMKLVIDVLNDARQLLEGLDSIGEMRTGTREKLREIVTSIRTEADRIVRELDEQGPHSAKNESAGHDTEELVQRGLTALADQHYDEAETWFQRAHRADPTAPEYLNYLGLLAWERDSYREAIDYYGEAMDAALAGTESPTGGSDSNPCLADDSGMTLSPGDVYARAMEGCALSLYQAEAFERAAELFDCLATMYPDDYASCRYLEGEAQHAGGAPKRALEAYRRAPEEPALLYNRGLAHWQTGSHVRCVRDLLDAVASNDHIARQVAASSDSQLTAARTDPGDSQRGYLSSRQYAEDYLDACRSFWHRPGAKLPRRVLAMCLEDGRAREYVEAVRGGRLGSAGPSRPGNSPSGRDSKPTERLARRLLSELSQTAD